MNKKNNEYWEHRKAEMIHSQIARADVTFDEISKVYNHSRKHIEKSIKGIFNKFQAEYGLSKKEAEQVIKIMRTKNKKLIPALSLLPSTPKIKQTIEMLSSAAYVSRINRLQKLLDEIDNVQLYIARNELRKTTDLYKEVAKNAYYGSIHQIQTQTGIGFSFNELDEDLVEKLLAVPWENKNYRDRVWDNATELSNTLKDEVTQAVLTGKSEKLVIDEISNRFNVGEFKAKRLVRTETAYINNEMEALGYIEADIEKYRFVAVLDIRTSHICREHDYKVYDVSKRQVGVNFPPLHPFCRSTTIPVLDTENLSELSRRARDPKTGKNIVVSADISYNEWYNQYIKPKEIVVNANEKVYNKNNSHREALDMTKIDLMAKSKEFKTKNAVNEGIRFSAKKVVGTDYNIWLQDNTKKIRDTFNLVENELKGFDNIPRIVILKEQKLKGIAGYNRIDDTLYISDVLHSEKNINEVLSNGYFASKNLKDILTHELAHKRHWDSAKRLYNKKKKRYNNVEEAKNDLDSELIKYINNQKSFDYNYLLKISENAHINFSLFNNINELVAEVAVLNDKIEDKELLKKVKGVLKWK